ncbi:MAG: DUF3108 domain-containing protein [Acidobacteriota bacterium]|nr:DUF3108 domain-containing protein [Acidobacteriota bacterium]
MISRKFKIVLLTVLLSLAVAGLHSANAQRIERRPFEPGEELIFKAEVSRALLKKVDVATFRFLVEDPSLQLRAHVVSVSAAPSALKFTGDVTSEGFFVKLFNLRFHQHVESTVDPDSLTVMRTVKLDEQGKRVRTSEATFDRMKGKVVWTERDPNDPKRPERVISSDFTGAVQDVVSAIYFLRTQQLVVGTSFAMLISDSGRVFKVPVRVVEKKRMKTVLGRVTALRVEPELFGDGGMVKTTARFSIWLTDDQRHLPVSAQLKGEFGTFDITLKKVSQQATPNH